MAAPSRGTAMTDTVQPKTRRTVTPHDIAFTVRLTVETDQQLIAAAGRNGLTKATFARELITKGLNTNDAVRVGETT